MSRALLEDGAGSKARNKCHYKYFIEALSSRRRGHHCESIYIVTSDTPQAQSEIAKELGSMVFSPHLPEHDLCVGSRSRSAICVQLAFAELLFLSKTAAFVYSSSSSFSEVVILLGGFDEETAINGCTV